MTVLSTDWTGAHGTSALRVSWSIPSAKREDVFGALGAYMFQGLALDASYDGGDSGFRRVGDGDRVVVGAGLHNHLQSSGEHNTSRAHSRSTSSANPSPASLSRHSVVMISFPWGKGRCWSGVVREGVGSSSQLGNRVDCCVGRGKRVSGGGVLCGSRGAGVGSSRLRYPALWLLQNLLHHLLTTIVSSALLLREGEENCVENVGKVIPGESSQELVKSSIHQQDKHGGVGSRQGRVEGLGDLYSKHGMVRWANIWQMRT